MEITTSAMKQTRIVKMSKGVVAAALAIDNKFRAKHGDPVFAENADGSYKKHWRTKQPHYLPQSPYRCAMITLTYRHDGMWDAKQIATLVMHYRKWFERNGQGESFHYVWVMELTEIGRPHYHLIAWFPKGIKPPMPDKQGWWPHGMTQAKYAVSPVGYIAKYASKSETKSGSHLPHRARLWGYGGLKMTERPPVAFALAPRWLKGLIHHECHPVKKVFERVVNSITYACGFVHQNVIRKAGWFIKSGYNHGSWFFGPYEYEGFTEHGIALSHRGVIEMLTSEGDEFLFSHKA